jgi:pyrroline-5-carboxylate reductase
MSKILLIGCGNMGRALLDRWAAFSPVTIVEPNADDLPNAVKNISDLPNDLSPEVIVLAVKPQSLDQILPDIAKRFGIAPTYLSIAAGKTISYYEKFLGEGAGIVRAMPNTPAMVGEGMTAVAGNKALKDNGKKFSEALMAAAGRTIWLDESKMDAVTAISGSGPAYFFHFMEALIAAGVEQGLTEEEAKLLAVQTCVGSAKLASQSDRSLSTLRENVTSPGGTTAAALSVLQNADALKELVSDAVRAAVKRARELSS